MGKGIKPAVPVKQYTSEVKKITKTIKKDKPSDGQAELKKMLSSTTVKP